MFYLTWFDIMCLDGGSIAADNINPFSLISGFSSYHFAYHTTIFYLVLQLDEYEKLTIYSYS